MAAARKKRSRKWMQRAFSKNKGKFSRKAARAGMSTAAYAAKEKGAPGALGKEARLAALGAAISRRSAGRRKKRSTTRRRKRSRSR